MVEEKMTKYKVFGYSARCKFKYGHIFWFLYFTVSIFDRLSTHFASKSLNVSSPDIQKLFVLGVANDVPADFSASYAEDQRNDQVINFIFK